MKYASFATSDLVPLMKEVMDGINDKMAFNGEPYNQDPTNNEPMLWLVKDHGLYLMTNLNRSGIDGQRPIAYAMGCHPENDDDWYDTCRAIFGGDDGAVGVPLQWVHHTLKIKKENMIIEVSEDAIKLNL